MADSDLTPHGAVFLSYAREDTVSASRIADALRGFGIAVWFDQSELRGGEAWDAKIKKQIRECALFVAVISANSQARGEGYFRREWKLAVDRTHDMHAGRAFLVPVVIDDTREDAALVPDEFMRVQWTRLKAGAPTPTFIAQIEHLLSPPAHPPTPSMGVDAARPGLGTTPAFRPARATPARRGARWIWLALAGAAAGIAVGFVIWQRQAHDWAHAGGAQPASAKPAEPATADRLGSGFAAAVNDKSIAVLPFENMSAAPDSAFFADGVHEDILTNLALVRELHVVSRTSVMQYRATTKTIRQIAQELGVAYILEGSVRRAGNQVRVTGQLIRAATDEHVWAKNYDRDLTNVFSIQSELAGEIANALQAELSPKEKELIDRRPTENLAAYDAFVKARELRESSEPRQLAEAETQLQRAVALDPKFAEAWGLLAACHAFAYFDEFDRSPERLEKAKTAIDTAVRLAPDSPGVIEMLGDYYYYGYRDYARATEQYQRLAILRPNDGAVYGSLGLIHRRQGRWRDSREELRRAVQLEPQSHRYRSSLRDLAAALCLYDEAVEEQRRMDGFSDEDLFEQSQTYSIEFLAHGTVAAGNTWLSHLPEDPVHRPIVVAMRKTAALTTGDFAGFVAMDRKDRYTEGLAISHGVQDENAAYVLAALGDGAGARARASAAVEELEGELKQQPANASAWAALGAAHVLLGHRQEALRCAQKAKDLVPESRDAFAGPGYSISYGSCLAWLGDKEAALAELARLLRTPAGENIYSAKMGTTWFPLRGDPRFEALVSDPKNNAPML